MKALTVRLDDNLFKLLKHKVIDEGTTTQQYILTLIKKDLGIKDET